MPPQTPQLQLESELPRALAVGQGTAVFLSGWCFWPDSGIRSLDFIVDGQRQAAAAFGMPRLDVLQAHHPTLDPYQIGDLAEDPRAPEDPQFRSYRSGFWGIVRIPARAPGECRIALEAELQDGSTSRAELVRLDIVRLHDALALPEAAAVAWPEPASGPPVAVCMATYNPPADLVRAQIDSIRAQTHPNWLCLISDDGSAPEPYAALLAVIDGDPRFIVSRSPRRLGFYHNFERALAMAPPGTEFVALADQDDRWHPDKLEKLLGGIGQAPLAYSDARVISRSGEVISETWWNTRRNNHTDILSLLVANAVTGAASLLRADLLAAALPFPPGQFAHFHDHWLGLVAAAQGEIVFVPAPLYDYVQHGEASLGHAAANQMASLRDRLRLRRDLHERVRMWRLHYFVDVCRLSQFAAVIDLRLGPAMAPAKRRALLRFATADRSPATMARLALRGARELTRGTPETLGAEWMLAYAFGWRRLLQWSARDRPQRGWRLDALPPGTFVLPPGRVGMHESARAIADKIAPLNWSVSESAPRRINLLIPTIDLQHFFGGYIGKMNLAKRLTDLGERVRIVTVDPVGPLPRDWRQTIESYSGLDGLFERVEVAFGRESPAIELSPSDAIVASTWWTAHIAADAMRRLNGDRFLYLIQEYESFTFPMGTYAALADDSYRHPHFALFSTELLRGYFRAHEIGVYAAGRERGDEDSVAFENAITVVEPPSAEILAGRTTRRLLFYARPEAHAARNMFELGVLALSRAIADGAFQGGWELRGIGTVKGSRSIPLGGGAAIELVPRSEQHAYADLLPQHDVGLALMYTPHPSLVPIEMASAGLITVTNSFENKTAEAMTAISTNLIAAEPSIDAIAAALREASAGASDLDRRLRGSAVRWSRSWEESFDDALVRRLGAVLACAAAPA